MGVASFVGVHQLRYREMAILRNGILLPLYDRPVMNRDSLLVFADLAFMLAAYLSAEFLLGGVAHDLLGEQRFLITAAVVGTQFAVFVGSGIYKRVFRLIGIDDVLGMLKTTALAVGLSIVTCKMLVPMSQTTITLFIVDYFFLISLTIGFRSSFQILRYLHNREQNRGKRLLIYGADANGLLMLKNITELNYLEIDPIGFIDEDPLLEGKRIGGYPVFGGHWRLSRIFRLMPFDEILICADSMKDEVTKRVKRFAEEHHVRLTRAKMVFEDLAAPKRAAAVTHLVTQSIRREEGILDHAFSAAPEKLRRKVGT
jgi:FlaA1/EpsC-like NDP-sugar epimerase